MSTVVELKAFLKTNNVKGYSNKNKEQLLKMVEEFKGNEFRHQQISSKNNQNIFNKLPNVNISQIGQYLNFSNTQKTLTLQKNFKTNLIAQFQTCARIIGVGYYNTWNEYQIYKFKIYTALENLIVQSPNLTYLELNYNLIDLQNYFNGDIYITEIEDILTLLKKIKKLNALNIIFGVSIGSENKKIYKLLNDLNLQYLSTDLDFYEYENLTKNLKYLRLYEPDFEGFSDTYLRFEFKIDTLDLSFSYIRDFNFSLIPFKNLRRLILSKIDYLILEDLKNVPNLEALEYNNLDDAFSSIKQWKNKISKSIKYLRCGDLSRVEEYNVLSNIPSVEYLVQENFFPDNIVKFSEILLLFSKTKYLHINKLYFFNLEDRFDELKDWYPKNNLKISFNELIIEDNEEIPQLQKFVDLFGWNLKLINESYYKLENYYTPDNWLLDHNFMLEPHCD